MFNNYLRLLTLFILVSGCKKEKEIDYVIVPQDKIVHDSISPGLFDFKADTITDTKIYLNWTESRDPEKGPVSYEVMLFDSVIAYDFSFRRHYIIENLLPNKEYTVSVIALDTSRNKQVISKKITTRKSFVDKVIAYNTGYYYFFFDRAVQTSDNGMLIYGKYVKELIDGVFTYFIMKLDPSWKVQWLKTYSWNDELKNLKVLPSGDYLVIREKSISRIDASGNELWVYNTPDKSNIFTFTSSIVNSDGNIVIIGASWRNWGNPIVGVEYYISEITQSGNLIWEKYGGTTLKNIPIDIVQKPNGNYLIFGTSVTIFNIFNEGKDSYWLMEADINGNLIQQHSFPNKYQGDDLPSEILPLSDGSYLLLGTATGAMGDYFSYNTIPRFMKVNSDGSLLWDNTYDLNDGGVFTKFVGIDITLNSSFLILSSDDSGIGISTIITSGELNSHLSLYNYPSSIYIKRLANADYLIVTHTGLIIKFNHDGYINK